MRSKILIAVMAAFCFMLNPTDEIHAFKTGDLEMVPSGRIGETFDDNITYTKENKKSDFITELRAGIAAIYEGKKAQISLSADVAQNLFAKHQKYNNNSQYLFLNIDSDPSKLQKLNFIERFSHVYEPQTFNEAFGITAGRYSYLRNYFGLDYSLDISKQTAAGLNYGNSVDIPSRDELYSSYSNSLSSYISHAFSSSSIISGGYSFYIRRFDQGGGDNAFTHALGVSLKQYATKQAYIDLSGGLDYITSYDKTTYLKPSYKISLTDDIDATKRAIISFEKKYDTNAYLKNVFKYWKVSGEFIWQVASRLSAFGSLFVGRGTYVESAVKDTLQGGNFGLSYALTERFKGVLSYRYSISSSTLEQNEYIKNTFYIGITAEF